jgi:hypothetical protein
MISKMPVETRKLFLGPQAKEAVYLNIRLALFSEKMN